jgi:hypothetical protein
MRCESGQKICLVLLISLNEMIIVSPASQLLSSCEVCSNVLEGDCWMDLTAPFVGRNISLNR